MRARGAHRRHASRRGGKVRWRRVIIVTVAVAAPLTLVAAAAGPASAAGGYTVTGTIAVGSDPLGVATDPAAGTVYVTNYEDNTVSVINARPAP
jgi:DNA-binding beta-propeller fold protein YncE